MFFFPHDFREPDGSFRDLLPADFVPVLYITRDGSTLCAGCLTDHPDGDAPDTTDDPAWRVDHVDLHYEGPDAFCDECGRVMEALYGDPDAAEG